MDEHKLIAAFLAPRSNVDYVYGSERLCAIEERVRLIDADPCFDNERLQLAEVDTSGVEVLFSTWGISRLTGDQLDRYFPNLKAVFYAAGTVGHFAAPFLERGVRIVSAYQANAIPVAEFTVAQIVLGLKGYFRNVRDYDGTESGFNMAFRGPGAYGETVGLLGAGAIGRHVIRLLKPYMVTIQVWDPFLSREEADDLGVEKAESVRSLFETAFVVSNHLADKPETFGLIDRDHLRTLRRNAVFINTGRGRTVDEPALIDVFGGRPDLTALLDVTHPEPPGEDSPLMALPNIRVTSHIAGSIGDEVRRMADLVIAEFDRYVDGVPLWYEITPELFAVMA